MEGSARQGYNTRRQSLILEHFRNNAGRHYTAEELSGALKEKGVSRSTVYRTLEKLVAEKKIVKYSLGREACACYRYCGAQKDDATYHFICTNCGAVQHLSCDMLDSLRRHLDSDHDLKLDRALTVLYGTCGRCLGK